MTWEDALRNIDVVTIEDPLHSAALSKAAYNDAYGEYPCYLRGHVLCFV
jgi:hypothetical protein